MTRSDCRLIGCMALAMWFGLSAFAQDSAPEKSPLDRLRERSAEFRWRQQRNQWITTPEEAPTGSQPADAADQADAPDPADMDTEEAGPATPVSEVAPRPDLTEIIFDPPRASEVESDVAPPAPKPNQTATTSESSIPVAGRTGGQQPDVHREVLPLPEFLGGEEPMKLTPRNPAPFVDWSVPPEGVANALVTAAQQTTDPVYEDRERGKLRRITEISPFFDYDPQGGDACQHLCPVPPSICDPNAGFLCPEEKPLPETRTADRYFADMNFFWAPSNIHYNPLYFNDPVLERYGQVRVHDVVQPFYSMARLGIQLIGLPYEMALHPMCDHEYPLGYYRPGDPAPKLIYQPPLNAKGGAVAAGVYTGLIFLVP